MPASATTGDRAKDVICHMMVDKATATKHVHEGTAYYFCAPGCLEKFKTDPKKHSAPCSCGKSSAKCPCEHCGHHLGKCDCGK
jgi:Cu+-exporting ATPase